MTPALLAGCCARSDRLAMFDCFERGLKTRRLPPFAGYQARKVQAYGLWACFSVQTDGRYLIDLRFECAACTTLIACCQALVELAKGKEMAGIHDWDVASLFEQLQGMPMARQDRAWLAISAFHAISDIFYSPLEKDIAS